MIRTQATTSNITEAAIQEVVEAEIEKYSHRKGLCKDADFCDVGQEVPKPYTRRLEGYKVISSQQLKFR